MAPGNSIWSTVEPHMGPIVNLRTARKQAKRRRAEQEAAQNRLAHGRSKAEKALQRTQSENARERSRPSPHRKERRAMKSPVIKRSIVIAGHKTSVSLEDAFWKGLKDIALARHMTLSDLVASIDYGSPAPQFVVGHPAVRARPFSGADRRPRRWRTSRGRGDDPCDDGGGAGRGAVGVAAGIVDRSANAESMIRKKPALGP